MPRAVRHEYEGAVYHVMCLGNNGQSIFEPVRQGGLTQEPTVLVKKGPHPQNLWVNSGSGSPPIV